MADLDNDADLITEKTFNKPVLDKPSKETESEVELETGKTEDDDDVTTGNYVELNISTGHLRVSTAKGTLASAEHTLYRILKKYKELMQEQRVFKNYTG